MDDRNYQLMDWVYEIVDTWYFRSRFSEKIGEWVAEAKKEPFVANNCILEPGDCWFQYGKSREEVLEKLKAEVIPWMRRPTRR